MASPCDRKLTLSEKESVKTEVSLFLPFLVFFSNQAAEFVDKGVADLDDLT